MEMNNTIKQRFVIPISGGIHLRPASILAKTADSFESSVTVWCNGSKAEAKSALSMMLLEASRLEWSPSASMLTAPAK